MANKKKSKGSIRAKANLNSKAGKRKFPTMSGKHVTTKEQRVEGRWLHSLTANRELNL